MILAELKAATSDIHARTERLLPSLPLLATRDGYVRCLLVLHGFHAGWEPAIWRTTGMEEAGFGGGAQAKLSLIESDLQFLGVGKQQLAISIERPILDSCAAALGALYVLEGATLGGQVIERHASRAVGVTPRAGGSYFHGHGERTGEMWRAFGGALSAWVDHNGQSESIVRGAVDCFQSLESWAGDMTLDGVGHE